MRAALIALITILLAGNSAEGAGPWKGQIVERDGGPIAGAVVLAFWTVRSWGVIHPVDEFHSAFEAVSDAEGRFVIPEHTAVPTKPLTAIRGPQILIFKAGFGPWEFQGSPYYAVAEDSSARDERIERAWEAFAKDGVGFALRRLTDSQQRLSWNSAVRPRVVPDEQMPRLLEALDAERVSLRVPPYHVPREKRQ